jgi:signal transduction histidine kinase
VAGTGLGLCIVRMILESHGGRAGFESSAGRGSTFYIELPVQA